MEEFTWINEKPLYSFGGRLLSNYGVGQSALNFEKINSPAGTGFTVSGRQIGLRTLSLPIHIFGETPENTQENVSRLLREFLAGKVKLNLPDGFLYFAVLTGQEGPTFITEEMVSLTLTLEGIRCRAMKSETGHAFSIQGTLPEMDCIIRVTVGKQAETYTVAGITFDGGDRFAGVEVGDLIVIDGISKRVTINGEAAMDRCDLVEFPRVHPGENLIEAPDPVTLEYYPTYL